MSKSKYVENKIHMVSVSIKLFILIWFFSLLWHMITFSFFQYVYFSGKKKEGKEHTYIVSIENFGLSPVPNESEKTEEEQATKEESEEVVEPTENQEKQENENAKEEVVDTSETQNTEESSENTGESKSTEELLSLLGIGTKENSESSKKEESSKSIVDKIISQEPQSNTKVYSLRSKENRTTAVQKYGGSSESENSVELGLKWLAKHQDYDGKWSTTDFNLHSNKKECWGVGLSKYTPGVTGLSYLAFLGAGYTTETGEYQQQLRKTEEYLISLQDKDGFFDVMEMYNHSIVLLALAESYAITKNKKLEAPIRLGIAASIEAQQPSGGWTYTGIATQQRNDTSITGWQVMALTSAKRAGFTIPNRVFDRIWNHFQRMMISSGEVRYEDIGIHTLRSSKALVPVAVLCAILMDKENPHLRKHLEIMNKFPPRWSMRATLDNSMYYWYHGTLCLFLHGGSSWKRWNDAMRDMLIENQIKYGAAAGSWEPSGKWCSSGSRIYATAINILNLEIYYRYHPNFIKQ